jgi:hypothetical protein
MRCPTGGLRPSSGLSKSGESHRTRVSLKPGVGLEPTTPSLPWKEGANKPRHERTNKGTVSLQARQLCSGSHALSCLLGINLMYPFGTREVGSSLTPVGSWGDVDHSGPACEGVAVWSACLASTRSPRKPPLLRRAYERDGEGCLFCGASPIAGRADAPLLLRRVSRRG